MSESMDRAESNLSHLTGVNSSASLIPHNNNSGDNNQRVDSIQSFNSTTVITVSNTTTHIRNNLHSMDNRNNNSEELEEVVFSDKNEKPLEDEEPVMRTRKERVRVWFKEACTKQCIPGYGIYTDLKRRIPYYFSDIKDGINFKTVASTIYMIFASVFPALSFGTFLAAKTENQIGVIEVLFSTALSGMAYSIFAGQPLVIVGVTGPVVIFCQTVFNLTKSFKIPFLPWLACIGFFSTVMHILIAIFNMSNLVKYVTRFTTEIFGLLIAIIYIINGIEDIVGYFNNLDRESALFCLILSIGSFYVAYSLCYARRWIFFPKWFCALLRDYAVAISVGIFTGFTYFPIFRSLKIPYLSVPPVFEPTWSGRNNQWLIQNYQELPVWAIFASILPALVLTALFFFDHNVSSLLSQKKEFNLKKGAAFHWDFFVIGTIISGCSVIGIPCTNGLIPQAPLHVRSLAKIQQETLPGGKTKETFLYVRENRLSNFFQSFLIGILMMFGQNLLSGIPQGIMTGIFLFMGFTSFDGNQFGDRLKLLFIRKEIRDTRDDHYLKQMPFFHSIIYTFIQFICLGVIYGITRSPAAIIFPILILVLIPIRLWILPFLFTKSQLYYLDNDHDDPEPYFPKENRKVLVDIIYKYVIVKIIDKWRYICKRIGVWKEYLICVFTKCFKKSNDNNNTTTIENNGIIELKENTQHGD